MNYSRKAIIATIGKTYVVETSQQVFYVIIAIKSSAYFYVAVKIA